MKIQKIKAKRISPLEFDNTAKIKLIGILQMATYRIYKKNDGYDLYALITSSSKHLRKQLAEFMYSDTNHIPEHLYHPHLKLSQKTLKDLLNIAITHMLFVDELMQALYEFCNLEKDNRIRTFSHAQSSITGEYRGYFFMRRQFSQAQLDKKEELYKKIKALLE